MYLYPKMLYLNNWFSYLALIFPNDWFLYIAQSHPTCSSQNPDDMLTKKKRRSKYRIICENDTSIF